ncbi:spondin domain-containing protein [Arenicella sp.]|nr:spondin domain-containing protein [Arenicella sp.]
MKSLKYYALTLSCVFIMNNAFAQEQSFEYQMTVTNLTNNQVFAPILMVSHQNSVRLFEAGEPASNGIAVMAEDGSPAAIVESFEGDERVRGAATSAGPLPPFASTTIRVPVNNGGRISVVSMLVNTNDAFLALNNIQAPVLGETLTFFALAYDAGTELNDELCGNIPGPACGGIGFSAEDGEGFVHIHRGMHGIGDLAADVYDWRNPVARITISRR